MTLGPDLEPIESVLCECQPTKVLIFHLPNHPSLDDIKARIRDEFGVKFLQCEELPYPSNDVARGERLRSIWRSMKEFEDSKDKSDTLRVCVSGGTKWMSHALHQVAFSFDLDVIVTSHQRFEGVDKIITLPSTQRAIQMAQKLDSMSTGTWAQLLLILYEVSPDSMTRSELSERLSISRQAIEHMYNGRQEGSAISAKGIHGIGVAEEVIVPTDGLGAPRKNIRLTAFGEEVARHLAS